MVTTTYRQGCGTHLGMLLHKAADESPCGECAWGELLRRVSVEEWPLRPTHPAVLPISKKRAAENMAALMAAVALPIRTALPSNSEASDS